MTPHMNVHGEIPAVRFVHLNKYVNYYSKQNSHLFEFIPAEIKEDS